MDAGARAAGGPLSPGLRILLTLATGVVVLAGLWFAREIVGPLVLAAVLVIICEPVRRIPVRWGWPRWAGTTAVIVLAYLVLAAMGALLWLAGTQFVGLVRDFQDELTGIARSLIDWLASLGLSEQAAEGAASAIDPSTVLSVAASLGGTVLSVATALFFVFAYVLFMAADATRYGDAGRYFGAARASAIERAVRFNRAVRRYYIVNASFGVIVAVIDGLALWALQVPGAVIWAILSFVTNFVPNVGFVLGLIPPAVLALVVGGWPLMLAVIAIYSVVNVTLQVLVQPKFVSDAVDLSLTLSFFSVVFWTFVIGPLGAILSVPLTLLVRAILLEGDPEARWLRWLSGDRTVVADAGEPRSDPDPPAVASPPDEQEGRTP